MARHDDLFNLVKAMTRSEKRHFKLQSSLHGGAKNYLRLFKAIDAQEKYDERSIKRKFAGETFIKQLHATKYYLRRMIMRSLRSYRVSNTLHAEARQYLRDAEILYAKELFRQAQETLVKAEEIATSYEFDALLCEILDLKRSLVQNVQPHAFEKLSKVVAEQRGCVDRLENRNTYVDLIVNVSQSVMADSVETVPNERWLEKATNATTLESMVMHYNARYFRQIQSGTGEGAEQTLLTLIDALETQPHRIQESPGLYVSSINNFVSYYVFNKEYEKALALIQRGKSVYDQWTLKTENRTVLKQILRTYTIELEVIRNHNLQDASDQMIDQIAEFISAHRNKMPREYLLLFWFQLAYIYYMRGDLKSAVVWVNEFIQTRHKNLRTDLQVHARILNLMIQVDQDNQFVLRYFVDSTRRYLRKYAEEQPYETRLLRFFSRMGRTGTMDKRDQYRRLQSELFPDDQESLVPESALSYIDYRIWLDQRC